MPTRDPQHRLLPEDVRDLVGDAAFQPCGLADHRGIGIEVEFFGLRPQQDGRPRRLTIEDQRPSLEAVAGTGRIGRRAGDDPLAAWPAGTGRLTFEPGGQLEYSGGVQPTAAAAIADTESVVGELAAAWHRDGNVLVSLGVDPWTDPDDIEQQLEAPRYRAMASYLAARGPAGRRMMRNTASVQVNVDPGEGDEGDERWRVANLAAPLVTATFASSPGAAPDPAVSTRARAWRQLDPTRTGVPSPGRLATPVDRVDAWTQFALEADVLLYPTEDGARPGRPGRAWRDWLELGDPELGWPTATDFLTHLSTLFPEVRPRGPLELRSLDGLHARFRPVPVVLLAGLLYDKRARQDALRLLAPTAGQLRDELVRAGEVGLKDPERCALAVEVWSFALAGARRLGTDWIGAEHLLTTERFLDDYTLKGRCPADELRARLADDPADALAWATEPVPSPALDRR